ncbi:DUF305 domain-containing protein [Micromonospora lupini]|uniref:DUF305 domain-containing protein n=1 Tax=Micromonospora lupini str. Lupac 08 TaxID=1150864 RepID=I0L6K8_9ACTN|nr:DUF305 domain-containing protein [Micromonospora lupini]CCH19455.1 Conserved exported hypothetical protein [Micromonospora lupini str. Lupac 08]
MRAHVALLTAVVLVAGCGTGSPGAAPPTAVPPTAAPVAATPSNASSAGAFSPTDIAWLQLTAAMTQRLLPVLDLVPTRTTDPTWRRLAVEVRASNRADLTRSRQLLGEAGAPTTNPHEGHDMPGMVTADELAALRSASGKTFHRLLAAHLRAYLTQTTRVATAEQKSGANPATTALATTVITTNQTHLNNLP